MKNKLKKIFVCPTVKRRLGDFICNFTAVVLGILLTFAGSNLIEEHKKQKELKDALLLVKNEMLLNRGYMTQMMEREEFEKQGASYLLQPKENIAKAAPDSLEKYGNLPFQTQTFIYINDAMEMLKTSSLMSAIRDKELATQIIKTYNAIKGSYETFNSFMEIKQKKVDKLINKPEVQKFLTNDADYSTAEEWTFFFKFPEGIQLIQQIYFTHDSPTRMYNRFIKQIDETASAIDEFYK